MNLPLAELPRESACLDDETLGAFLEGWLDPSFAARIDGHAASCTACRELIALGARVAGESIARPDRVGASVILAPKNGRVGTVLKDKWRLDAVIGVGGMAEVYAGTHRNGKRVAVKILLPQLAVDPELCRRFVQEGYIANHVGHPNVVAVHDDDVTDEGAPFIVMDLLEGECVADIITRGRMPASEAVRNTLSLLDVLATAHRKGVLHRDIKPGNLFRTQTGELWLLDFGIARVVDGANATMTGATMGTPAYMPPEQARGLMREVDARSDLWAAGATLFSMLTAAKVREAETNNELLVMAVTQPVRSIAERAPWLHPALVAIVDRSLAFDKAQRFQSAAEMSAALAALPPNALLDPTTSATVALRPATYVPATVATPPPQWTIMSSSGSGSVPPVGNTIFRWRTGAATPSTAPALILGGAAAFVAVLITVIVVVFSPGRRQASAEPVSAVANTAALVSATTSDQPVTSPITPATTAVPAAEPPPAPPAAQPTAPTATATAKKPKSAPSARPSASPTLSPPAPPKNGGVDPLDRRL